MIITFYCKEWKVLISFTNEQVTLDIFSAVPYATRMTTINSGKENIQDIYEYSINVHMFSFSDVSI